MITAAHCLFDKNREPYPAESLHVLLGLHDRRKDKYKEPQRCYTITYCLLSPHSFFQISVLICIFSRKEISVDEIFIHEGFGTTNHRTNDIALLRLSNFNFSSIF